MRPPDMAASAEDEKNDSEETTIVRAAASDAQLLLLLLECCKKADHTTGVGWVDFVVVVDDDDDTIGSFTRASLGSSCCIRKVVSGESDDDDERIDVVTVRGKRGGTTATNANDDDDGNDKLDSIIIIHINVAVFGRFRNVAGNMLLLLMSAMMDSVGRRKSPDRKIYDRTMRVCCSKERKLFDTFDATFFTYCFDCFFGIGSFRIIIKWMIRSNLGRVLNMETCLGVSKSKRVVPPRGDAETEVRPSLYGCSTDD